VETSSIELRLDTVCGSFVYRVKVRYSLWTLPVYFKVRYSLWMLPLYFKVRYPLWTFSMRS